MRRRALLAGLAAAVPPVASRAASRAEARQDAISVGVTAGPHAEIAEAVARVAATSGLALRVEVSGDDGRGINWRVRSGRLDAASFQDGVAFADETRRRPDLASAATTVTLPVGIYSRRLASLRALGDGDTVGIPSDPAGAARALILLQNYGLLALRDAAGLQATARDVVGNPRHLRLVALPSGRLGGALDRLACAVIDRPHAAESGLLPARDSIGLEDARSPYAGVLAVRRADLARPWVRTLVAAYHSEEVKRFLLERYRDSVRRPW